VGTQQSEGDRALGRRPLSRRGQTLCIAALIAALLGLTAWLGPGLVALAPYLSHVSLPWWAIALAFATTAHFDGWSAVLIRLDRLDLAVLREVAVEAWGSRAPRQLVAARPR
jgi:hypothetical protein